jgi:hypothetical protein
VLVAHACNPSYLGGRDQEDWGSKPVPRLPLQGSSSKSTCLASVRPWVQTLVPSKKKKKIQAATAVYKTKHGTSATDRKPYWSQKRWGSEFRAPSSQAELGQQWGRGRVFCFDESMTIWPMLQNPTINVANYISDSCLFLCSLKVWGRLGTVPPQVVGHRVISGKVSQFWVLHSCLDPRISKSIYFVSSLNQTIPS